MPQVVAGSAIAAGVSTALATDAAIAATGKFLFFAAGSKAAFFAQSFAVSAALGVASQALAPKPPAGGATGISVGNTKDPISSRKILYGEVRTGGTYILFGTSDHVKVTGRTVDNTNGYTFTLDSTADYTHNGGTVTYYKYKYTFDDASYYYWTKTSGLETSTSGNKYILTYKRAKKNDIMNILIAVAGHEVEDITDVYYDEKRIGEFNASGVFVFDAMDDYDSDGFRSPMFFRALGTDDQYIEQLGDNTPYHWADIDGYDGDVVNSDGTTSRNLEKDGVPRNQIDLPAGRCCEFVPDAGDGPNASTSNTPPKPFFTWDERYQCNGTALLYARLRFWASKYNSGLPKITCTVKGKKVYDPREVSHDIDDPSTWEWSSNAALCILDYLMDTSVGMGIPASEIDMTAFTTAANSCDTYGFTLNGQIDTASTPRQIIEGMLTTCAGKLIYSNGKFKLYTHYDLGTYNGTFDESNFVSGYKISTRTSNRELYNGVKGIYAEPDLLWQPTEYPPVTSPNYAAVDGRESIITLDLPFTTSIDAAIELAELAVLKSRQQMLLSVNLDLSAIDVTAGDMIKITNARLGFTEKEFEVIRSEIGVMPEGQLYVAVDGLAYVDTAIDPDLQRPSGGGIGGAGLGDAAGVTTSLTSDFTRAVAWCVFDGTDYDGSGVCTINAQSNIASVVRSAAGRYTVTFGSELFDEFYSVVVTTGNDTANGNKDMTAFLDDNTTAPTATAFVLATDDTGGTPQDPSRVSITVFR